MKKKILIAGMAGIAITAVALTAYIVRAMKELDSLIIEYKPDEEYF